MNELWPRLIYAAFFSISGGVTGWLCNRKSSKVLKDYNKEIGNELEVFRKHITEDMWDSFREMYTRISIIEGEWERMKKEKKE